LGDLVGRKINVTIIDGKPTDFYHWELVMPTVIFNQLNEAKRPKDVRIDPTKPPSMYGAPVCIRLVPHREGLPEHVVEIPPGASPVYFCLRGQTFGVGGAGSGVVGFAIGHRVGDVRRYKFICPVTGDVIEEVEDTIPSK
jgi:hypothetical protein